MLRYYSTSGDEFSSRFEAFFFSTLFFDNFPQKAEKNLKFSAKCCKPPKAQLAKAPLGLALKLHDDEHHLGPHEPQDEVGDSVEVPH